MRLAPGIRRLLRLGGVHDVESAVDDELAFHLETTVRELVEGGMREDEARREAERRFGDVRAARGRLVALDRERVNAERRADWWRALGQELRFAVRGLRLRPGFTIGVVLTLGLGIGANATMFEVVDRLLLRPPAYMVDAERVRRVHFASSEDGRESLSTFTTWARLLDMRGFTRDFDVVAGMFAEDMAVGSGESAAELRVTIATADWWRLFEMRPALGRFFTAAEDSMAEPAHVAVLGYGYWLSRFGGSASVLGQPLRIGRNDYTIVGVTPPGFTGAGLGEPTIVIPMSAMLATEMHPDFADPANYGRNTLTLIVRRRAEATPAQAANELTAAFRRSYEQQALMMPGTTPAAIARPRVVAAPVQVARGPNRSRDVSVAIWLVGVSAIVLLIACANVSNLLLARAFGRRREIAVRLALGVGRGRLIFQLLTESVVLALLGGAAGMTFAQVGGGVLRLTLLPSAADTSMLTDTRVLLMCAVVALLIGVVTGLAPALHALRSDVAAALKSGSREGARHHSPLRATMLVAQGALSVLLLVGSGLFVQSLRHAQAVPMGYDPDRVLYVVTVPRGARLSDTEHGALQRRLQERVQSLPGVESAARVVTVPFGRNRRRPLFVEGTSLLGRQGAVELQSASPEYFATMGTRILRGRGIEVQDRDGTPWAMVVSQSLAHALWPRGDALGQCVRVGADTMPCTTVVGIAEDIKTASLSDDPSLFFYLSIDQKVVVNTGGLLVRTRGDASAQANTVRRALQELMPGDAYVKVTPLADQIAPQRRSWELGATMFTVFGLLALLVASVGLYSVISYGVAQRSQELAVRVALGAPGRDIVRIVVGDGLRNVLLATGIGLGLAWLAARWVGPLLFQTSPRDPVVYGGVAVLLVVVALVASVIPASRAARADPIAALRAE